MEYDAAARRRLGYEIRAARVAAGYKTREPFAQAMDRSTRQVQALEKGETGVGEDTWAAAAAVLGWPLQKIYSLLDGAAVGGGTEDRDYVAAPGDLVEQSTKDDVVLAEVRAMRDDIAALERRLDRRIDGLSERVAQIESRTQSVGGPDGSA